MCSESESKPISTKMQSRRGPGMSPLSQKGVERMTSQYIPPGPDGLLGARKVAVAECAVAEWFLTPISLGIQQE
jgi:hypothetical protein